MAGLDERLRILRDDAPLEEPRSAPAPLAAEKESTISQPNYLVAQVMTSLNA